MPDTLSVKPAVVACEVTILATPNMADESTPASDGESGFQPVLHLGSEIARPTNMSRIQWLLQAGLWFNIAGLTVMLWHGPKWISGLLLFVGIVLLLTLVAKENELFRGGRR
jgi:hypothetical protein